MTKYIEEQEILWRMNNALDEQDTYLPIHFKKMVIDECNTADVVERSKIDKAFEELQKMKVYDRTRTARLVSLPEVFEILKKNIGE